MKVGELMDLIDRYNRQEAKVAQAELALLRGGSPETMQSNRLVLEMEKRYLDMMRGEDVA